MPGHPTTQYRVPIPDGPFEDLVIHMPAACSFIDRALTVRNSAILVHCDTGYNRSVAIVAAYCEYPIFYLINDMSTTESLLPIVMRHRAIHATEAIAQIRQGEHTDNLTFIASLPLIFP